MKNESIISINVGDINIWDSDFNYKPSKQEQIKRDKIKSLISYELTAFIIKKTREYEKELNQTQ